MSLKNAQILNFKERISLSLAMEQILHASENARVLHLHEVGHERVKAGDDHRAEQVVRHD